ADLAAHRAATFVHAVANSRGGLHASANVVAKPINLAVTASGRENGADAKNPRSRNLPLGNGGPQCENNIGITGAHVSHGSETGGQRDCRVVSRIESDLGIGIFDRTQSVSLVELRRQVHVAIDEPRKDEFFAKIDKLTARRRIDEAARHRLDPLTFDKNALLRFGLYVWMASLPTAGCLDGKSPYSGFATRNLAGVGIRRRQPFSGSSTTGGLRRLGRRRDDKSKMPRNARLTPDLNRGRAMPTVQPFPAGGYRFI